LSKRSIDSVLQAAGVARNVDEGAVRIGLTSSVDWRDLYVRADAFECVRVVLLAVTTR
jgi:hypothetical protein